MPTDTEEPYRRYCVREMQWEHKIDFAAYDTLEDLAVTYCVTRKLAQRIVGAMNLAEAVLTEESEDEC